jgi:hypothetical protein
VLRERDFLQYGLCRDKGIIGKCSVHKWELCTPGRVAELEGMGVSP